LAWVEDGRGNAYGVGDWGWGGSDDWGKAIGGGSRRDEASWGSGVGSLIEESAGGALGGDSRVRDGDGDGGAAADAEGTVGSGGDGLGFFLAENEFGGFRAFFEDGGGFSESIRPIDTGDGNARGEIGVAAREGEVSGTVLGFDGDEVLAIGIATDSGEVPVGGEGGLGWRWGRGDDRGGGEGEGGFGGHGGVTIWGKSGGDGGIGGVSVGDEEGEERERAFHF
jgi:hypothetical protein